MAVAVFVTEEGENMEKGMPRMFKERFPALGSLKTIGKTSCLRNKQQVDCGPAIENLVFRVNVKDTQIMEIWENGFEKLNTAMRDAGITKIAIPVIDGVNQEQMRKLAELFWRSEDCEIAIHYPKQSGRKLDKQEDNEGWKNQIRRRGNMETITIKPPEGKSYLEAVKIMKEEIKLKETGVRINRISKTGNGNVQLSISANSEEGSKKLKEEIQRVNKGAKILSRQATVFIKDIDEATTEKEVREVVEKVSEEKEFTIQMSKNANKYGMQYAIVSMATKGAEKTIKSKRIRSSWGSWRVEELINLAKCYKCLGFGHKAHECTNTQVKEKKCFRCSGEHEARTCKEAPRCYICNKDGHTASSMACPKYRDAVKEMKKKKHNPRLKWRDT